MIIIIGTVRERYESSYSLPLQGIETIEHSSEGQQLSRPEN
jgi:hypothetical protein